MKWMFSFSNCLVLVKILKLSILKLVHFSYMFTKLFFLFEINTDERQDFLCFEESLNIAKMTTGRYLMHQMHLKKKKVVLETKHLLNPLLHIYRFYWKCKQCRSRSAQFAIWSSSTQLASSFIRLFLTKLWLA